MKEIWKGVIYQGKDLSEWYEVSNYGKVRSTKTKHICKQHEVKNGYWGCCVTLGARGKNKCIKSHRAVAETFIDNPKSLSDVNHKDGVKAHNFAENLEWVSKSENMKHASRNRLLHIRCGESNCKSKLTNAEAENIKSLYATGLYTQKQIAQSYGISTPKISRIVRGKAYNSTYLSHSG